MPKLLLGPVLYARSGDPSTWSFSIHLLLEGTHPGAAPPVDVTVPGASVTGPTVAADFSQVPGLGSVVYWRWTVAVPRTANPSVRYTVRATTAVAGLSADIAESVAVPAADELPRIAFFSCSGISNARAWCRTTDPYAMWDRMLKTHSDKPFHLLLGGGDQLYADSLFEQNPTLSSFRKLSRRKQATHAPPAGFETVLVGEYVRLYIDRWQREDGIGEMLARTPCLFTWDDHDIFDGWGSREALQASPMYQCIFRAAATAFAAFQLGRDVSLGAPPPKHVFAADHYEASHAELEILRLDSRSARTASEVLGADQWDAFDRWRTQFIAREAAKPRHVLVVVAVPLVYMRFSPETERTAALFGLRDDLLDQWESQSHSGERDRLVMNLLDLGKQANAAVTVVSGDVHVASRAHITSTQARHVPDGENFAVIHQVTSSGIVHPEPSPLEFLGISLFARNLRPQVLAPGVEATLIPVTEGQYFLPERNWLSIYFDRVAASPSHKPRMWLRLYAERTKDVHLSATVVDAL